MPVDIDTIMTAERKAPPWQTVYLGDKPISVDEALRVAGCDFIVEKLPAGFWDGQEWRTAPGRYHIVRKDTNESIGAVGRQYEPQQNSVSFGFGMDLIGEGAITSSAGNFRQGAVVFIAFKLPEDLIIGGVDTLQQYLVVKNTHDGSSMITAVATYVRPVCQNTLAAAIAEASNTWAVRHTVSAEGKLDEARRALQLAEKNRFAFTLVANNLIEAQMDSTHFKTFLEDFDFPERSVDLVTTLYNEAPNLSNIPFSAYRAYNALTEFWDWGRKPRTEAKAQEASLFHNEFKDKALGQLVRYAEAVKA